MLPARWPNLTSPAVATIGVSAARARAAREGTVQHALIDSLYVRSWT
jgi:hypothetical protein